MFSISSIAADRETLKRYLFPLLHKYKIDALLSGHNHNMQYLTSKKYNETMEYKVQNQSNLCSNIFLKCNRKKMICFDKNVTCKYDNTTCADKETVAENHDFLKDQRKMVYKKGEELHQITMGASGADLDHLCLKLNSPMADLVFGLSDFGFAEFTITEDELKIKYIHANTSETVFESIITA